MTGDAASTPGGTGRGGAGPPGGASGRTGGAPGSANSARRRRRNRWIAVGALAVVLLWGVAVAVAASAAATDARRGMDRITQARADMSTADPVVAQGIDVLDAAGADFSAAHDRLDSPLMLPLRVVPVIGRQLASLQALAGAAAQISTVGSSALSQAQGVLDRSQAGGAGRVATLTSLARIATATHAAVARIPLGSGTALVRPLAAKRALLVQDVDELESTLQNASSGASAAAQILQGPQTYLVLVGNNAEMRAGSGMFLEAGVLTTDDGTIRLGGMFPTPEMALPPGEVTVTGDLEARWGWLRPGVDWRNLGLTPQFDVNAPLAARMWQAETGQRVGGVLAVDIEGLRELLTVTGPITQGGREVSAGDVVQLLEHDQYEGLDAEDATAGSQLAEQAARSEQLGALASATIEALEDEPSDLRQMGAALAAAAEGRHIMLWSAAPALEADWRASGVSGELTASSLAADVVNRGGNKLDQYLDQTASLSLSEGSKSTRVTLTTTLTNETPPGQSSYIAGPFPGLGTSYGQYVGILALNLPLDAEDPVVEGHPTVAVAGREGPTWVVGVPVDLLDGRTTRIVVHFTLPGTHGTLSIVPSGRVPAVTWSLPSGSATDAKTIPVAW